MRRYAVFFCFLGLFCGCTGIRHSELPSGTQITQEDLFATNRPAVVPSKEPIVVPAFPPRKVLNNSYHIFQTFNNCGPASLSMALSYFDIHKSQEELGQELRPYQNPKGDNDDKSVSLEELGKKAGEYGLIAYHRPNGTIEILEQLINADLPVVTRTWLKMDEDIGHYRVVKGYDQTIGVLIQDDSYQGKNKSYSYQDFEYMWGKFNNEYLVLVPPAKKTIVEQILGENVDPSIAWRNSVTTSRQKLSKDPSDVTARFNLVISLANTQQYKEAVTEFEKIANKLPPRALWYQTEPFISYYQIGDYDTVLRMTDAVLQDHNRAYSELYILRGDVYKQQGRIDLARAEYQKAITYNVNLQAAKDALKSL